MLWSDDRQRITVVKYLTQVVNKYFTLQLLYSAGNVFGQWTLFVKEFMVRRIIIMEGLWSCLLWHSWDPIFLKYNLTFNFILKTAFKNCISKTNLNFLFLLVIKKINSNPYLRLTWYFCLTLPYPPRSLPLSSSTIKRYDTPWHRRLIHSSIRHERRVTSGDQHLYASVFSV